MRKFLLLLVLISGCVTGSTNISENTTIKQENIRHLTFKPPEDMQGFRVSPNNKYAIVIPTRLWDRDNSPVLSVEDLITLHTPRRNPCIDADVSQMLRILSNKDYDTYELDMWQRNDISYLYWLLDNISRVANKQTKLVVFMTGKSNSRGFSMGSAITEEGELLSPPYSTVLPRELFDALRTYAGEAAVFANMSDGGVFASQMPYNFKGIVIGPCDDKPQVVCNKTGTTELVAEILDLYSKESEIDLEEMRLANCDPIIRGRFRF